MEDRSCWAACCCCCCCWAAAMRWQVQANGSAPAAVVEAVMADLVLLPVPPPPDMTTLLDPSFMAPKPLLWKRKNCFNEKHFLWFIFLFCFLINGFKIPYWEFRNDLTLLLLIEHRWRSRCSPSSCCWTTTWCPVCALLLVLEMWLKLMMLHLI